MTMETHIYWRLLQQQSMSIRELGMLLRGHDRAGLLGPRPQVGGDRFDGAGGLSGIEAVVNRG